MRRLRRQARALSGSPPETRLGGAFAGPVDGAVLPFRGETPEAAERFAQSDPYVVNGLITRWHVREWTTVVGAESAAPVYPADDRLTGDR